MTNLSKAHEQLVNDLTTQLRESNLAIFAGAGLSVVAGYVNWSQLLKPIADDLDLDIAKETDLVALAQYHCNANHANRAKLNQILVTNFAATTEATENHEILARLPIATYWTTNYDKVIESALTAAQKHPDVKYTPRQLAFTKPRRDVVVYKMHGDVDHPGNAVLTRDDYETYHKKMKPFLTALSGDLVSKTFLFVGFSFTDPNLEYILSRVRVAYDKDQRQHHAVLRKLKKRDDESDADFEYGTRKQELFVNELLRVGVKTTWIDEFEELTEILRQVENKFKQRTVFVSGAAHIYGKWATDESEKFVFELSKDIAEVGYRVVSGFGLGVGGAVITGVLESIYMKGGRLDNEQLILRPFPQHQVGTMTLKAVWTAYRNDMLSYAGIAVFLFGNKLEGRAVVFSSGMREEYEIAKAQGAFLIPVGITGYMAEELWNEVIDDFQETNHKNGAKIKTHLQVLGDLKTTLDGARKAVLEIIKLIS